MSGIIGLIPARGGSRGVPRKNIRDLAGKPLLAWTIEAALKSGVCDSVIVSTDDDRIARIAAAWGAEVPFLRPADLATDTTPQISVVRHLCSWLGGNNRDLPGFILLLQPTSPFRSAGDITAAVALAEDRHAHSVVSLCEARDHPCLAMRMLENGTIADFLPAEKRYTRRQDLPPAYTLNGAIYLNAPEVLLSSGTFTPPGTYGYLMPPERSLDIDTAWDFHIAELLMRERCGGPPG